MIKVLFICHGNICRSPMAEFVMKDMAAKAGAGERFVIDSAATSQAPRSSATRSTHPRGRSWRRTAWSVGRTRRGR